MAASKKSATCPRENTKIVERKKLRKDENVILLIKGLAFLIAQAKEDQLGTAVRILATAHEDLVYWAASMDFDETTEDAFVYRHLFDSGLFPAAALMVRIHEIKDTGMRQKIFDLLGYAL